MRLSYLRGIISAENAYYQSAFFYSCLLQVQKEFYDPQKSILFLEGFNLTINLIVSMIIPFFTLCLLTYQIKPCPTSFQLNPSCTIQGHYSNHSTCQGFMFLSCKWKNCLEWSTKDSSVCLDYMTVSESSKEKCATNCCEGQISTKGDLVSCQNGMRLDTRKELLKSVITSITLLLMSIFMSVCWVSRGRCLKVCLTKISMGRLKYMNGRLYCIEPPLEDWEYRQQVPNSQPIFEPIAVVWQEQAVAAIQLQDTCCVCLENDVTTRLLCGHVFHLPCIINCLKNKRQCIICRSKHLIPALVYCQSCLKMAYKSNLLKHDYKRLSNTPQRCRSCQIKQYQPTQN